MGEIEKVRDGLYIKEGWDGYRVVHPLKNDDGTTNWKNVLYGGHWSNIAKAIGFVIILYFIIQMYISDTSSCREFVANMGEVCQSYYNQISLVPTDNSLNINLSQITLNYVPKNT